MSSSERSADELRRERVAKHIAFLDLAAADDAAADPSAAAAAAAAGEESSAADKAAAQLLAAVSSRERAKAAAEAKARKAGLATMRMDALEDRVKGGYESQQRVLKLQQENDLIRKCLEGGGKGAAAAGDATGAGASGGAAAPTLPF